MKEKHAGWVWNSVLCFKFEIIKFLSCLFTKLQDDPFKNKALLFSNNAQELHPDPFQTEDPFKSDPFKGADPFKGISLGAHLVIEGLFTLCLLELSNDQSGWPVAPSGMEGEGSSLSPVGHQSVAPRPGPLRS